MSFCLFAGWHFSFKVEMKGHCVYIPDAILFICRISLLIKHGCESALCLYSGCHCVYMPDVNFVEQSNESASCQYSDVILFICRMAFLFQKALKAHCVYFPDAILCRCRMQLLIKSNESASSLYFGFHFVYMPDVKFVLKKR